MRQKNTALKATLRYCLECKKVWEIGISGSILFYSHLPTYKLPRKICKACNNLSIDTYEKQMYHKKRRMNDDNV